MEEFMSIPDTSVSAIPSSPADPGLGSVRRAVPAPALRRARQWLRYGLYAVSILHSTQLRFPGGHGELLALLTFAVSFIFRPLVGSVWGPMGDRLGRKRELAPTILLMAGSSFC